MRERIAVSIDELGEAIRPWIRGSPRPIWMADELYEALKAQKRHDPAKAPDPRRDLAAWITDQFARARWQVTRAVPENIFEGVGERPEIAKRRANYEKEND